MNRDNELAPLPSHTQDLSTDSWANTYAEIVEKAELVRQIFKSRHIKINPASALSRLLAQAAIVSNAWDAKQHPPIQALCEAAHVNRLADAVIALPNEPGIHEALRRMAGSDMRPDSRDPSQGKDALWELILLGELRERGIKAVAAEPDILVNLEFGDYGIACKKIWSEKGIEKHISKGCKQLALRGKSGVIALNLDDLLPAGKLLAKPDKAAALNYMTDFASALATRHAHVLHKALAAGKCDGFIISCSALTVLANQVPALNLIKQSIYWHSAYNADGAARFQSLARAHSGADC